MKKTTSLIMVFFMIIIKSFSQSFEYGSNMTAPSTINENQSFQVSVNVKNTTGTSFAGKITANVFESGVQGASVATIQELSGITINANGDQTLNFSTNGIPAMKAGKIYEVVLFSYPDNAPGTYSQVSVGSYSTGKITVNTPPAAMIQMGGTMSGPSTINQGQGFTVNVDIQNAGNADYTNGKLIAQVFDFGTANFIGAVDTKTGVNITANNTWGPYSFTTAGISGMLAGKKYAVVLYYDDQKGGTPKIPDNGSFINEFAITVNASSTTDIKMGSSITGPSSITVGSIFTLQAKFRNDGNANFVSGTFDAEVYEEGQGAQGVNGITSSNDVTGITVNANSTSNSLTFSFNDVSKLVAGKKYEIKMWYVPNGTSFQEVPSNGSFSNLFTISVNAAVAASLEYGNNMTAPSSINENQGFQVSVNLKNTTGSAFYGKIRADVFESSTNVATIQELNGITINGNGNQTLTFSTNGIAAMKAGKTYEVVLFSYPDNAPGTYSQVSVGSYTTGNIKVNANNQIAYSLVYGGNVSVTSQIINENQGFAVSVNIKNTSSSAFSGTISADIFDAGANIGEVQALNGITINGNSDKTYAFSTGGIAAMKAGKTYDVVFYERANGGSWAQISKGSFAYGQITVNNNQASVAKLEFGSNINAPASITQGQGFTTSLYIRNVTNTTFQGNIRALIYENGGSNSGLAGTVQTINNITINGGNSQYYSFSTNGISAMLSGKKYGVYIEYQTNGSSWTPLPTGSYNGAEITVVGNNQTSTALVLGSNINGPSNINQNQAFAVDVTIKNNGSIAYVGRFAADVYNSSGGYIATMQFLNGINVPGNGSKNLNFTSTGVPGMTFGNTYAVKVVYEPNGQGNGWVPVPNGSYQNAKSITVNGTTQAGVSMAMASAMIINPSDFKANTPFSVYAKVINTSNTLFNGKVVAHVYDASGAPVAGIGLQSAVTINAGSKQFLTFNSSSGINLSPGTYYIKLSYVENTSSSWVLVMDNGSLKNSETISVTTHHFSAMSIAANEGGSRSLSVYPNPNEGVFSVNMDVEKEGAYTIEVYNELGAKVYTESISLNVGSYQKQIDIRNNEKGIYIVRVLGSSLGMKTQKIILQ
jgi:hypothetical protein